MLTFLLCFSSYQPYLCSLSYLIKLLSYSANGVFFSGKDFKNKFKKNT